ncbi:Uncharacterized protein EbC_pEb17200650 (plasmid) [Erwinia billingiae Eb661]|uniref:Uncharacterized protein n=1 Tax=Erwinia billingiae (strain Eb661) TaxID=634500 RepID=D8MJS0_ERWBE|nr:Uncharacterized protein EbC_pEb17200650 [Erwinia billingiae Eb661]
MAESPGARLRAGKYVQSGANITHRFASPNMLILKNKHFLLNIPTGLLKTILYRNLFFV